MTELQIGDLGRVRGVQKNGVTAYLGVPYALPPTGSRRFAKPQPVTSLSDKLDYTATGPACIQPPLVLEGLTPREVPPQSEDCLYLNIWMPSEERQKKPEGGWPVLAWIHGGWLQFGNALVTETDQPFELIAKSGADLPVMVVAIGYRLNVFGFCAGEGVAGNYGFWDQRCALEFVHKYISYFGGNPGNVTLGGLSAGAYSTQAQLNYELFDAQSEPLFQRVFMQSNAIPAPPKSIAEANGQLNALLGALGIATSLSASEKLERLRAISVEDLLQAATSLEVSTFRAVIDNDFISPHICDRVFSGELSQKLNERGFKVLIGEVEHEEAIYALVGAPTTEDEMLPALGNYYRADVCKALLKHYGARRDMALDEQFGIITSDVQVRASIRQFAKALVDGGLDISNLYRYRISYILPAMRDVLPPALSSRLGHGFDANYWFYLARNGFSMKDKEVVKAWLALYRDFLCGKQNIAWGTHSVDEYRQFEADGSIKVKKDPHWNRLLDVGAVLRSA